MSGGDSLRRFAFDHMPVQGAVVRLADTWETIAARNAEAGDLAPLLGEACAAAALMFTNIKLEGQISLQLQGGDGPLRLLLSQCDSAGRLRAVLRGEAREPAAADFAALTRGATLAITIESRQPPNRYQGIVPLGGASLAAALEGYFSQSEQLPTRLWLTAEGGVAAGLLLQRMPGDAEDPDGWNRAMRLAETITPGELRTLDAPSILHRLFHREVVRVHEPEPLRFGCSCDRDRVVEVLRTLGEVEIRSAAEATGELEVACEFCNERYRFDAVDLGQLFSRYAVEDAPRTPQ